MSASLDAHKQTKKTLKQSSFFHNGTHQTEASRQSTLVHPNNDPNPDTTMNFEDSEGSTDVIVFTSYPTEKEDKYL